MRFIFFLLLVAFRGYSQGDLLIRIDTSLRYQQMEHFGASDCWVTKFVGKNWPLEKREQIADLLFSRELDSHGQPVGIGLGLWRMNVGAGSFEQGNASMISPASRREECFLSPNGSYNWNKQAGSQWFAKAAATRGVSEFLIFSNAPPVQFSLNGLAFPDSTPAFRGQFNLKPQHYTSFARFLTTVAAHYQASGIPVRYISPINEPNWDWIVKPRGLASQEGSGATNEQSYLLIRALDMALDSSGLDVKISLGESGSHQYTYADKLRGRSDYIKAFWDPSSATYVGALVHVDKAISSHSYFTNANMKALISNREKVHERILHINPDVKFWQSEYCVLGEEDGIKGAGRDTGMQTALYVARVIHTDLVKGFATSWQWWLGMTMANYKDGLVYLVPEKGKAIEEDGQVVSSKTLWTLGNFSRFIEKGMQRVAVNIQDSIAAGVMASAWLGTGRAVLVLINNTSGIYNLSGLSGKMKAYITSDTQALSPSPADVLPARSVMTVLIDFTER